MSAPSDPGGAVARPAVSGSPARDLPPALAPLLELALDLRWTWSHAADALWRALDAGTWARTRNAWYLLQSVAARAARSAGRDRGFLADIERLVDERTRRYLDGEPWLARVAPELEPAPASPTSAWSSASARPLPIYAGGLGILAGDYLRRRATSACRWSASGSSTSRAISARRIDADGRQQECLSRTTIRPCCRSRRLRGRDGEMAARLRRAARPHALAARLAARRSGASRSTCSTATIRATRPPIRGITAQALRRRAGDAPAAGDGPRRRRLAPARGARPRARRLPPERGPRGLRRAGARALLHARAAASVREALVGDARRQHLHHAHPGGRGLRSIRSGAGRALPRSYAERALAASGLSAVLGLGRANPDDDARAIQHGLPGDPRLRARSTASAACTAKSAGGSSSRLFPRWPERRCRSRTSPTACTCPRGTRAASDALWTAGVRQGALAWRHRRRSRRDRRASRRREALVACEPQERARARAATCAPLANSSRRDGAIDDGVSARPGRARPGRADPRLRAPLRRVQAPGPAAARSRAPRPPPDDRDARCSSSSPARPIRPTRPASGSIAEWIRFAAARRRCASASSSSRTTTSRWPSSWCQGVDVWINTPGRPGKPAAPAA